jgi:hypothetical protein
VFLRQQGHFCDRVATRILTAVVFRAPERLAETLRYALTPMFHHAAALFDELSVDEISDLDLAYTPPFGSPWDALQVGAQSWRAAQAATPSLATDA